MTNFEVYDAILTKYMNNMIVGTVILFIISAVFIVCAALGAVHHWKKTKKGRREKAAYITIASVFLGALIVLFSVRTIGYHLDIKNQSDEFYYGEMEYDERDASKKRGAEYYLILDPDGERIFTTHSEKIEKDEGRYLGCAVYSKRTKILLYYEFFE